MYNKIEFKHYNEIHTTSCTIRSRDNKYIGSVTCKPEDYDFENKLTGENLAYLKALIHKYQDEKRMLKSELKALTHTYDILKQNEKVNNRSIECYTLRRQIKLKERDIKDTNEAINYCKLTYSSLVLKKDVQYKSIRRLRMKTKIENLKKGLKQPEK